MLIEQLRLTNCDLKCVLGFGGSLDLKAVLDFVDSGHDLIVAADANASDFIRNIAAECGVDFDEVTSLFTPNIHNPLMQCIINVCVLYYCKGPKCL